MSSRLPAQAKTTSPAAALFTPATAEPLSSGLERQALVSQPPLVQGKLTVGRPNDPYEQEADRMADLVMRMPEPHPQSQVETGAKGQSVQAQPLASQITPLLQRQIGPEENPQEGPLQASLADGALLQRQEEAEAVDGEEEEEEEEGAEEEEVLQAQGTPGATPRASPALQAQIATLRGGGHPLPQSVRSYFEPRFGHDLSQVRIHADAPAAQSARALRARAFTTGQDIVFGAGQYQAGTPGGQRLLAHELTHVVQQARGKAGSGAPGPSLQRQTAPRRDQRQSLRRMLSRGQSEIATPGKHYRLWNFRIGRHNIRPGFQPALAQVRNILRATTAGVHIVGHCSHTGRRAFNVRLALRRAQAVRQALIGQGIEAGRIWTPEGRAWDEPVASNRTAWGRARNRRVDLYIAPVVELPPPAPKQRQEPSPRKRYLEEKWVGIGETHGGDLFIVGAHQTTGMVINMADEWPNVRWAWISVSGYKFGLGLGGSIGATLILVNGARTVSEIKRLTPGGWDFDLALGLKLKGVLSTLKGIGKIVRTLDEYKKLHWVGEQAIKNREANTPGVHTIALPLAGKGLHAWAGFKFGEVDVISHGVGLGR